MIYATIKDGHVVSTTKNKPSSMCGWTAINEELPTRPAIADDEYAYLIYQNGLIEWRKRRVVERILTVEDYDAAMEDYIREVRIARGYTTREPDDYFGSSNPRWAQDAKDWVAFRDAVMTYALDIINTYSKTGNAPTLAAFKAGFPKMVWSYAE